MTTKVVDLVEETNPWKAQAARFDLAAQKLNLDEGLWKVLQSPSREIIVHIPVMMDDWSSGSIHWIPCAALHRARSGEGWFALCAGRQS